MHILLAVSIIIAIVGGMAQIAGIGLIQLLDMVKKRRGGSVSAITTEGDIPSQKAVASSSGEGGHGEMTFTCPILPMPRAHLIGRDEEESRVRRLVMNDEVSLVTLTGPGGAGKTALARQAAAGLKSSFTAGVAFVDLAPIRDASLVIPAIAQTLGIKEIMGQSLLETVPAMLQGKRLLLVLDNFEQVLDAALDVRHLLSLCPDLKVLVTSRKALQLTHTIVEHLFPVFPLALPHIGRDLTAEAVMQSPSVLLFVKRAQAVDPDFSLNLENCVAVAEICTHLDGLPLAIELAATRIKLFGTPQALLARLIGPSGHLAYHMLESKGQDVPSRQRALQETVAWSYNLLDDSEKALFRQMSVFVGGCTLHAAECVCKAGENSLQSLIDANLVHRERGPNNEPRCAMLETIREYGCDLLEKSGEKEKTQREHTAYFLNLSRWAVHRRKDELHSDWVGRFEEDQGNVRAALTWAFSRQARTALRLAWVASMIWYMLGRFKEADENLDRALKMLKQGKAAPVKLKIRVLDRAATLAVYRADCGYARELSEELLKLSRESGETLRVAQALHRLGNALRFERDFTTARQFLLESLALFRGLKEGREKIEEVSWCLFSLGKLAMDENDWATARGWLDESLRMQRQLGTKDGVATILVDLGFVLHKQGASQAWQPLLAEAQVLLRQDRYSQGNYLRWCLHFLGRIEIGEGHLDTARTALSESLAIFRGVGDELGIARTLMALGWLAARQGELSAKKIDWQQASRLLGAEETLRQVMHLPPPGDWESEMNFIVSGARRYLGEDAFGIAWKEGQDMSWEDAVRLTPLGTDGNSQGVGAETFSNPIVESGADPWVILWQGDYYYSRSVDDARIVVSKAKRLQDIGKSVQVTVWVPPSGTEHSQNLWAPELHYLDEKWFIYFAADDGENANHRMYVLEGDSQDPQGTYTFKGKITAPTDRWAIDGTVLVLNNGIKYFIWSGWEGTENIQQNLYIAPMSNPWTISGERVSIATPTYPWERLGTPYINEGPQILKNDGQIFIIYSASGSWTDDYCLGQLTYTGGDILKMASWVKKNCPVFTKTANVFGPGHASLVKSRDGTQDWIIYHAAKHSGAGWDRSVRAQKFTWGKDGSPNFGEPVPEGSPIEC